MCFCLYFFANRTVTEAIGLLCCVSRMSVGYKFSLFLFQFFVRLSKRFSVIPSTHLVHKIILCVCVSHLTVVRNSAWWIRCAVTSVWVPPFLGFEEISQVEHKSVLWPGGKTEETEGWRRKKTLHFSLSPLTLIAVILSFIVWDFLVCIKFPLV